MDGLLSRGRLAGVAALFLLALAGCRGEVEEASLTIVPDIQQRVADYAPTEITADLSHLTTTQRQVLKKLVEASRLVHDIFIDQALPRRREIETAVAALQGPDADAVRRYFQINAGPWDRRFDFEPFVGDWPHPAGANYYPLDLTDLEKERIAAGEDHLADLTTMVRRDDQGNLTAVPYSEFFGKRLGEVARLLREAADLTENASLAAFLRARADALLDDDYFESDMLWMDLDSPVEVTIGPYETYEDGLFGYKAAFESFVTITDPVESARLEKFKTELPWLEAHLPIPDEHKNPNRGTASPIRVVDEVFTAGDTRTGIQTIAFNLPNDERVREAKGSKKVLLRNIMNAKFQQILVPLARQLLAAEQLDDLASESFFLHTLFHEMSHGLGPGRIVKDGRQTEVRLELKELYSALEEAKADAMAPWVIFQLQHKGYFPDSIHRQQAVTYLAGLFRSVRFGVTEAHGRANAIQFNYLREAGVITREDGRYRIDVAAFPQAIERLVHEILMLEALGDYDGTKAFIERYGDLPPDVEEALHNLHDVPVDVYPIYASVEDL